MAHRQINPHERDLSRVGIGCGWVLECVRLDDESLQGGKASTIRVAWPTPARVIHAHGKNARHVDARRGWRVGKVGSTGEREGAVCRVVIRARGSAA